MLNSTCSKYILFPEEIRLRNDVRAVLYILGLLYCFIGLSSVTGRFFIAMEHIVRQTYEVVQKDAVTGVKVVKREKVWNYTIADITLLAFGTSFPQISLATIDALKNLGKLDAGGLGPGTLVGSAACDLFLIHAVCIIIPQGAVKKVMNLSVWIVELIWSLWAYIWLYIIVQVWTPEVITTWEASMTVLQFFLLLLHAYAQDQEWPFVSICMFDNKKRVDWVSGNPTGSSSSSSAVCGSNCTCPSGSENIEFDGQGKYQFTDLLMHWKQQFIDVMQVKGPDPTDRRYRPPTGLNICWNVVMFPWKFMFALVPPTAIFHGWVTFICTLVFITAISYIVTNLTNLIGCVTGVKPYAISLTALATGTSWPDLVASVIAADCQATADSALANITCSNSVNIFIGIGVPWVINTFYNYFKLNAQLTVSALGLGFTLLVYLVTSILCIAALVARRYFFGGELGGPQKWAWASSAYILFLWIIFLVVSCLHVYNII
eukprot:c23245_g1_i1 orf=568-2034(-)